MTWHSPYKSPKSNEVTLESGITWGANKRLGV